MTWRLFNDVSPDVDVDMEISKLAVPHVDVDMDLANVDMRERAMSG